MDKNAEEIIIEWINNEEKNVFHWKKKLNWFLRALEVLSRPYLFWGIDFPNLN